MGIAIITIIPSLLIWGLQIPFLTAGFLVNSFLSIVVFSFVFITLERMSRYPGVQGLSSSITIIVCWYSVLLMYLLVSRTYYSGVFLLYGFLLLMVYIYVLYFVRIRINQLTIAYPNYGAVEKLNKIQSVHWLKLEDPSLPLVSIDGVAADLHASATHEWQQFYVDCAFKKIPVFNYKQLEESLTGRVKIEYLYENQLGTLLPSPTYSLVKRVVETLLVIVSIPIVLPIVLLAILAIKMESKGPVFFVQDRVGQGNRLFQIYKLRSMCVDSEKAGAQFASENDSRITTVGKFIRKSRIDELPQFWNVLKGDMSLIGPRPEQAVFVRDFSEKIPFYAYRHMVKPGISGWAQVMHGYAADEDETQVKIEYDFYYIKHFSLWLDLLIVFKTIKTMLSGFGSR